MERLQIIRGDDTEFTVQVTDKDDQPIDITGCTVFFTAKRKKDDTDANAAIKVDVTDHEASTEGETRITISKTITAALSLGDYYWDVQIKYPDGKIQSAMFDILTVIPQITQRTTTS